MWICCACLRVSFARRISASVKLHASKRERRRSAFRKFVRPKSTSLKTEARRSHPERSASVKLTSLKSFQQRVDSDRSEFLNETGPTSDLPQKVRGMVRVSRLLSSKPTQVRKNLIPRRSPSSKWGRS